MTSTPPKPEVDPDHVHVTFSIPDLGETNDSSGSMTLRIEEVKRLGLMVGDTVTITIVREQK